MAAAWRAVCDAHPAMDTTFARILYNDELLFFSVELAPSTLSEPARIIKDTGSSDVFENELKVDHERGFRFGGSMFRLVIMEGTEQSHKMILSCHHAICDGWSLNIILRDLASAYQGHGARFRQRLGCSIAKATTEYKRRHSRFSSQRRRRYSRNRGPLKQRTTS